MQVSGEIDYVSRYSLPLWHSGISSFSSFCTSIFPQAEQTAMEEYCDTDIYHAHDDMWAIRDDLQKMDPSRNEQSKAKSITILISKLPTPENIQDPQNQIHDEIRI
jgi:hypothetical protein